MDVAAAAAVREAAAVERACRLWEALCAFTRAVRIASSLRALCPCRTAS